MVCLTPLEWGLGQSWRAYPVQRLSAEADELRTDAG